MSCMRRTILGFVSATLSMCSLVVPVTGLAETIAMIGTGEVGSTLGPRFALEGLYLLRANSRLNDEYFEWNYPEGPPPR